jgi:hypothetical protein
MEMAVDRLAKVIHSRGSDAMLDDSVDTRELLADISNQVSRLLKKQNAGDPIVHDNAIFDVSEEEGQEQFSRGHGNSTDSNGRPTPYDLWSRRSSAAGKDTPGTPKTIKLTSDQWDGLVQRLNASLKQHDVQVAATQRAIIAKELADVTFTPRINERSRQLANSDVSIVERTALLEAQRSKKLNNERQRLAEKELEQATFTPKINEISRNMVSGATSRLYESPFEKREALARKATMEREAAEKMEYTFSPAINRKSREMAVKGKALQLAYSPARSEVSPRRNSEESFMPAINAHSRKLVASAFDTSKPVFERLYEEGMQTARKARENELIPKEKIKRTSGKPAVVVYRPGLEFILETLEKETR